MGIGIYGLQGMSSDKSEVSELIAALATKISQSEVDFDAQALSNALYGLQVWSSLRAFLFYVCQITKINEVTPFRVDCRA